MKLTNLCLIVLLAISPLAFADDAAPVVSADDDAATNSSLTIDQRVAVLERQMSALNQINLMNQVNDLQQKLQELQGQFEELSHTVQTLQTQSTSQYSDLDQRLKKLENPQDKAPADSAKPQLISANSSASTNDEQAAYQDAYSKAKDGHYAEGIKSMQDFLAKYPSGTYAPNAHYWLGQLYLLKGDGQSAAKEFNTVLTQYPQSDKVKDADLKLGFAYLLQNKNREAKVQFKKVIKAYPGTSTAQLAEARLAELP